MLKGLITWKHHKRQHDKKEYDCVEKESNRCRATGWAGCSTYKTSNEPLYDFIGFWIRNQEKNKG